MNALAVESPATLLVPKNRGLAAQVAHALDRRLPGDCTSCAVRGEDVPYLANELARAGRRVLAFTGDDLVEEWLAAGNAFDPQLARSRVLWRDPEAMYGAPALCLIGPAAPVDCAPVVRVGVCARYLRLAQRFLTAWCGSDYALVPITGALEAVVLHGVADFVIDIVVTGKTIDAAGLRVHRVISTSDLAVLESRP